MRPALRASTRDVQAGPGVPATMLAEAVPRVVTQPPVVNATQERETMLAGQQGATAAPTGQAQPVQPGNGGAAIDFAAAIVAAADDAIIATDLDGRVLVWNHAATRIFGYEAGEMLEQDFARLIPPDRPEEDRRTLAAIARGERIGHLETLRLHKDGRLINVSVSVAPVADAHGRIVAAARVIRDVTEQRRQDRELVRVSRLYAALSQVSLAVVTATTQAEMLDEACRALVVQGGFRTVGICWHIAQSRHFVTVARHGDNTHYLDQVTIFSDERPEGMGPMGRAFRSGQPYVCNDVWSDPATLPWRARMRERGWHASAAFPIRVEGTIVAMLTVYAQESGFFKDREIALLTQASRDVAFGIENIQRDEAHHNARREARSERAFTAALIDSVPGVLYLYDDSGNFIRWNRDFEQRTGYSGDEIRAMHPADFIAPRHRDLVRARIAEVFATGRSAVEADLLARDGTATPYYFTGLRTQIDGRVALLGVGIDISARVRAEAASRTAQAELARVARVSLLGEFTASVSHEINQPLAAIVTNSSAATRWLAKNPPDIEEVRQTVARITRDADRASGIIRQLRAFVTRDAPQRARVDLNQVVREVLAFADTELAAARIVVRTELDIALPGVQGDHIQLQQVLLNLIANAIDAMRAITDRPRLLELRSFVDHAGAVCVRVCDHGTGFDVAGAARLFEHFYSTKSGGMGLGLAISRGIVEACGGRIEAMAGQSRGAIFQIALPRAPDPA